MQMFQNGRLSVLNAQSVSAPISLGDAAVYLAHGPLRFEVRLDEEDAVFVLGLKAGANYQVEVDDEEVCEMPAGRGGILALTDVPRGKPVGIRLKELPGA